MPTYDYICRACEHEFEEFQSMSAKPLKKCPSCGKAQLERLIGTGAGVIFKGGGFYETDYRSDAYKKAADADKKSSTGESSEGSGGAGGGGSCGCGKAAGSCGSHGASPTVSADKKTKSKKKDAE